MDLISRRLMHKDRQTSAHVVKYDKILHTRRQNTNDGQMSDLQSKFAGKR